VRISLTDWSSQKYFVLSASFSSLLKTHHVQKNSRCLHAASFFLSIAMAMVRTVARVYSSMRISLSTVFRLIGCKFFDSMGHIFEKYLTYQTS
jgi:hypothetical protein